MRTLTLGLAMSLWGLVVFVVGLHVNFPSEALLDRARWEVQDRSDGAWALDAHDARLWRLTGIEVDDATLLQVPRQSRRDAEDGEALELEPVVRVDSLAARVHLLPLLTGTQELGFLASVFGGELGGSVGLDETRTHVVAKGSDLDLSRMPTSGEEWSIDAAGVAELDVDISTDTEDIKASTGRFKLEVAGLELRSATVMGMSFDQSIPFSQAVLDLKVDDGKATVETGRFVSDVLDATIEGEVTLNKRGMSRWRVKLDIAVELGGDLEQMAKFAQIDDAKDDEGVYHFICTGALSTPRCRVDALAAGNKPKRSASRKGRRGRKNSDDDDSSESDEDRDAARAERRERRLQRLRERRERLGDDADDRDDDIEALGAPPMAGPDGAGPMGMRGRAFRRSEAFDEEIALDDDLEEADFDELDGAQDIDFEEFDELDAEEFIDD